MKAIVCTGYGPSDVLQLKEVEQPTPKDDEILARKFATTASIGGSFSRRTGMSRKVIKREG